MKTSNHSSFPKIENEFLENILRQLVSQYAVIQLFYHKERETPQSHLVIHLAHKADADQIQSQKWVAKVRELYNVHVLCIYATRLHRQLALGHPFFEWYCRPSVIIYQDAEAVEVLVTTRDWGKYRKKFNGFQERFYSDHESQREQLQRLVAEGATNSVFTAYGRLIEHDMDYLEELYTGSRLASLPLNERISLLARHVPQIQQSFVRKSSTKYYLTELFAKAAKAIDNEEVLYETEMFEAIGRAEKNLYALVEGRLDALKKLIKKSAGKKQTPALLNDAPKDNVLDAALQAIVHAVGVEQIYLFHQTTYGDKKTYYLLMIADGLGNGQLKQLTQSVNSKNVLHDFVLVSHGRYWIQKNVFQYQQFFAPMVRAENLVWSSGPYHPEIHWETPHQPYHGDLYFHYRATHDTAGQFFTLASDTAENYQCLPYLFSLYFLSFCRTYIYVNTYYLPNDLSNNALWQLCIYAAPEMRKYDYLFGEFAVPFFPYLDRYMTLHHRLNNPGKEQVAQMKVIVEKLGNELHKVVTERGLLEKLELEEAE